MTNVGQLTTEPAPSSEDALAKIPSVKRFRHAAAFGRRIEYWIIGLMMKEGLDVYVPLVDDKAIDAIVRRPDGNFAEVQIKACSKTNVTQHFLLQSPIQTFARTIGLFSTQRYSIRYG